MTAAVSIATSPGFVDWLDDQAIALALTTYRTHRVFLLGRRPDGTLSAFERLLDRPMGMLAQGPTLTIATRWQIWTFENRLGPGEEWQGYDADYAPRTSISVGEIDVHDIGEGVVFVSSKFSCLATPCERHGLRLVWKPSFLSEVVPEDRCHLNGLATIDGRPAYATAVSRSDIAAGWRDRRRDGGIVVDVRSDRIVAEGLSMPHSPRWHRDRLWLLNSGTGDLGTVDRSTGVFEPVAFCPGYARGLAFHDRFAVVGLSGYRDERMFQGLALQERLTQKDAHPVCGLWIVDIETGRVAHWLRFEGVVSELYDVAILGGVRRPRLLGFRNDDIERQVVYESPAGRRNDRLEPGGAPGLDRRAAGVPLPQRPDSGQV